MSQKKNQEDLDQIRKVLAGLKGTSTQPVIAAQTKTAEPFANDPKPIQAPPPPQAEPFSEGSSAAPLAPALDSSDDLRAPGPVKEAGPEADGPHPNLGSDPFSGMTPSETEASPSAPFAAPAAPVTAPPAPDSPFADPVIATPAPDSPFASPDPLASPESGSPLQSQVETESPFSAPASPQPESPLSPGPAQADEEGAFRASLAESMEAPAPAAPAVQADAPFGNMQPADTVQAEQSNAPFGGLSDPATQSAPASTPPSGPGPLGDPVDILFTLAEGGGRGESGRQAIMVQSNEPEPKKSLLSKTQPKVKFESLPFDSIIPGHPLVIAVYSPSGGTGKSTTSMNLGVCMATIAQNMAKKQGPDAKVPRILTLDGDIVMGSLSLRLTGKVSPNLYTLQKYLDDRIAAGFEGEDAWPSSFDVAPPGEEPMHKFMHWPNNPSNFNVLAAPSDPKQFYYFGPNQYKNILKLLGRFYDVIVIDCGTEMVMDSQRAWLSHAHEVFLMTSPDSDRLYNSSKAARILGSSNPHPADVRGEKAQKLPPLATTDKMALAVIRSDSDSGLPLEKAVDKLFPWLVGKEDQKFWLPDVTHDITKANNAGRFLVKEHAEYAKVINRMAKHAFVKYQTAKSNHGLPSA